MKKVDQELQKLRINPAFDQDVSRVPVVVKCAADSMAAVAAVIESLGGAVRQQVGMISTIAAWLPLSALETLADRDDVRFLHLEQEYTADGGGCRASAGGKPTATAVERFSLGVDHAL